MTVHLVKLCVGIETAEELVSLIQAKVGRATLSGMEPRVTHITRMIPRRTEDLLSGGSLYWVIKGHIQVRQRIVELCPFKDEEGIKRCEIVLEPKPVLTASQPRRPFQGWRYLKAEDAPQDMNRQDADPNDNSGMKRELADLGLI